MNNIVFQQVIEGDEVVIRYPTLDDAAKMHTYVNNLSNEKTFVTLQGEAISLEEEKQYLMKQISKINTK